MAVAAKALVLNATTGSPQQIQPGQALTDADNQAYLTINADGQASDDATQARLNLALLV